MFNEKYIISIVDSYLYDKNKLNTEDFKSIFNECSRSEVVEIIRILKKNNIEIVIKQNNNAKEIKIDDKKNNNLNTKNLKNLSNEQLCALYKQGKKEVLNIIIEKNENLIWSRVRKHNKFLKHKLEEEDLFQSGALGLMKAVEGFKADKGANLSTYSIWWIDQKIKRDIIDYGFTIRIPVHMVETIIKVTYILVKNEGLSNEKILEIVKKEGISEEKFNLALSLRKNILTLTSINTLVGEDSETELIDLIEDKEEKLVEDQVVENIEKEIIQLQLNTLKEREKNVLQLRFGLVDGKDRTLEEIGQVYGVTRERIRQIESKALKKLKHPSRSKKLKDFIE
ncbi:sigma-70 family RNA polymerase sigma factor [Clostridium sp. SM-530-WT-3G]|uniref:sigma-70 family RNA polymerase sigma factor n=1 Tax=Clostridium sp. SM-530-WT-3G TaxID=2725303 RepID=UPI00145F373E|nr:sigma-70 family RNA polymerase sigma factor [Clostridium sp. SM-530-WT-3G]NME83767.1 sigma-70 family RNA polymerase sigma factor [Clostridium sp. SM-530-WT-3G]